MPEYLVTWAINLDADSPEDAAEQARLYQTDPDTLATVFYVLENGKGPSDRFTVKVGPNGVDIISKGD